MIEREILIANNRDQSKYRIVTGAETLGELQDDIARNERVYKMIGQSWVKTSSPIDVSGLTFTEGITKTQLLQRDSALPTNVQFKGQTTNNLVMLLTNTTKQIRSGVDYPTDRKLFSAYIKSVDGMAEFIKKRFRDNWTRVSTDNLIGVFKMYSLTEEEKNKNSKDAINEVREELKDQEKVKEVVNTVVPEKAESAKKLPDVKEAPHAATVEWFYCGIKSMVKDNLLAVGDVTVLADLLTELASRLAEEEPKISSTDIDDMMESILR